MIERVFGLVLESVLFGVGRGGVPSEGSAGYDSQSSLAEIIWHRREVVAQEQKADKKGGRSRSKVKKLSHLSP